MIKKSHIYIFWGIFILVVALFTFIYIVFPPTYDEWGFMSGFLEYDTDADGHHTLWMGIRHMLFKYDRLNAPRLGNTIGPLLLLVPRWIPSVISGIGVALSLWMMLLLAGIRPGQIFKIILLSFMFVFAIDWHDHMFCLLYSFNYLLAVPLLLGAVYYFIYGAGNNKSRLFFLALILGLWHESYAFSFIAGSGLIMLLYKKYRNKNSFALLGGVVIGLIIYFSFPSIWTRSSNEINLHSGFANLKYLFVWFIAFVAWTICFVRRKYRNFSLSPLSVFFITSGIITIPIAVRTSFLRVAMPAMVLGIIFLLQVLDIWWPRFMSGRSAKKPILSIALLLVVFVHLGAVAYESVRYNRATEELIANVPLYPRGEKNIFTTVIYPWDTTPLALRRPDVDMFVEGKHHVMYIKCFFNEGSLKFIPKELKDYKKGEGESLSGHNDYRLWNGLLVSPNLNDTIAPWAKIKYKHYEDTSPLHHVVFEGSDGNKYVYTQPIRSIIGRYMGDPIGISYDVEL